MSNFVQIQGAGDGTDYVNRNEVVRVHAEGVSDEDWVVKVLLSTGTEVVDSRHGTKAGAVARVASLVT
jgi:hypothetical protein